MANLLKE